MNNLLFDVIRSMSKNEKGFFKKASRLHSINSDKVYLRLFDVIDQMNNFDEQKLKRKTSGFISPLLLPATKNYLRNALMKSLRQFKETISPEMEMNTRLSNIEILFRRRLTDHCRKEIAAAKRLMENAELYNYFHIIAYWEKQLLNDSERSAENEAVSALLTHEESENIARIINTSLFDRIAYRMYSATYTCGDVGHITARKQLDELMQDSMLASEDHALTTTTKIIYHNIHSKYAEVTGNNEEMFLHLDRVSSLFETKPKYKNAHISKYMNALYNNAKARIRMGGGHESDVLYDKLRRLPAEFDAPVSPVFMRVYRLLLMNLRMHTFSNEKKFIEISKELDEYRDNELASVPIGYAIVRMEIECFFAFAFFATGQFRLALKWSNTILENKKLREDVIAYIRLMLLAIHYELENDILLTSELKSVKRFLEKSGRMTEFESSVIEFVRLLISLRLREPTIRKKLLNVYREAVKCEPGIITGRFNSNVSLISWMKSKLVAMKEFANEL